MKAMLHSGYHFGRKAAAEGSGPQFSASMAIFPLKFWRNLELGARNVMTRIATLGGTGHRPVTGALNQMQAKVEGQKGRERRNNKRQQLT